MLRTQTRLLMLGDVVHIIGVLSVVSDYKNKNLTTTCELKEYSV